MKDQEKAAAVVNKITEALIAERAGKMHAAFTIEGQVFEKAEGEKATASGACWTVLRDTFRDTLAEFGPDGADVVADTFKARATLDGDKIKARAGSYVSSLKRASKAVRKGLELPAGIWELSRGDYSEHPFWQGQKDKRGSSRKKDAGKKDADADVGEAAEKAVKDSDLSELNSLLVQLTGPFRAEFLAEAKALALATLQRQTAAKGGSRG